MRPQVGQVYDGYKFKGGDPNSQSSWESMAVEPFAAPTPTMAAAPKSSLKPGAVVDGYAYKGGDPNSRDSWEQEGGFMKELPKILERTGTEMVGGTVGTILGAPLGPLGALAGGTLGTMLGSEAGRIKQQFMGQNPDGVSESITSGLAGPVLGRAGELIGAGARYALKPVAKGSGEMLAKMRHYGFPESVPAVSGSKMHAFLWEGATKAPGGMGIGEAWNKETQEALGRNLARLTPQRAGSEFLAAEELRAGAQKSVDKFKRIAGNYLDKYRKVLGDNGPEVDPTRYIDSLKSKMEKFGQAQATAYGSPHSTRRLNALMAQHAIKDEAGKVVGHTPMSWDEADSIRMAIGEDMGRAQKLGTFQDMAYTDLKKQYKAISEDMEVNLAKSGNKEALDAWKQHRKFYRRGQEVIEKGADRILKSKRPETFLKEISSGNYRAARVAWGAMSSEARPAVRDELVYRMGLSKFGQQGAEVENFSPSTFLTNYAKLNRDPGAKTVKSMLYGRDKKTVRELDELAQISERIKGVMSAENVSRTAPISYIMKNIDKFGGLGGVALMYFDYDELGGALIAGSWGARGVAKLMTNKNFIRWLSTGNKFTPKSGSITSHIARLSGLTGLDSYDKEIAAGLQNWLNKVYSGEAQGPSEEQPQAPKSTSRITNPSLLPPMQEYPDVSMLGIRG